MHLVLDFSGLIQSLFFKEVTGLYLSNTEKVVLEVKDIRSFWRLLSVSAISLKEISEDGTNYHKFGVESLVNDDGVSGIVRVPTRNLSTFVNNCNISINGGEHVF